MEDFAGRVCPFTDVGTEGAAIHSGLFLVKLLLFNFVLFFLLEEILPLMEG